LRDDVKRARFERAIAPHLDAAYNLARWLTGKDHDAEDVVQEAYLRAFQFLDGFRGGDGRAWLLAIVRNTCYTWLERNRAGPAMAAFEEDRHSSPDDALDPEKLLLRKEDRRLLREALEELPVEFREVLVLRELEGFSYKEIAGIANVPIGTVMSRLARARDRLQQLLAQRLGKET
jgi:RNA polymerase sigma-70 factor (ECF subfamily)